MFRVLGFINRTMAVFIGLACLASPALAQTPFSDNTVTIYSNTASQAIFTGNTDIPTADATQDVFGNTLIYSEGANFTADIFGGYTITKGKVYDNSVEIYGTVSGIVAGGYTNPYSLSWDFEITDDVLINHSYNNRVVIGNSASVNNTIYGGYSFVGNAYNNEVIVMGDCNNTVYGGHSTYGGASNNTVHITSSGQAGSVTGGLGEKDVTGNTVIVEGTVNTITGGYCIYPTEGLQISDNTIILKKGAVVNDYIYGYFRMSENVTVKNNKLVLDEGYSGSTELIKYINIYEFNMSGRRVGDTVITITTQGASVVDLTDAELLLTSFDPDYSFAADSGKIVLIDRVENGEHLNQTFEGTAGLSHKYSAQVEATSAGDLAVTGITLTENPQTEALNQGQISGAEAINQGQNLMAGQGLDWAELSARQLVGSAVFFAVADYGDHRIKNDFSNRVRSWTGLAGLGYKSATDSINGWLAGIYVEAGTGSYRATNNFDANAPVHSKGDISFYGLGVFARYRFQNQLQIDATAHFGRIETTYEALGWVGDVQPNFKFRAPYVGAHLGVSYAIELSESSLVDLSLRYFWNRQAGRTVEIMGEQVRFNPYNSSRIQAGARLTHMVAQGISPFVGVYLEYELAGQASSKNLTSGVEHPTLKNRGATGIAELGLSIQPTTARNIRLDASVNASIGRRQGWGAQLAFAIAF